MMCFDGIKPYYTKGIVLDKAATTQVSSLIVQEMTPYFIDNFFNPSALYKPSKDVKEDINNAREIVANSINAKSNEIFFTSGGSESNSWVIQGFKKYWKKQGYNTVVITTPIEHKSVKLCVENEIDTYDFLSVNKKGQVNIDELENLLNVYRDCKLYDTYKILVSIQFANNEIGTVQHIKTISKLCHKYGAYFHTDAVQAYGHIPINVCHLDIDYMSVSGHKVGLPKGIGFLYKKENAPLSPIIYGMQENGMRGGTENVPYIMAFTKTIKESFDFVFYSQDKEIIRSVNNSIKLTRQYFVDKLLNTFNCTINKSKNHLYNIVSVTFNYNITAEALMYMLETADIYIGTGSACNSQSNKPSYVLKAIGLSDWDAVRTVRFSFDIGFSFDVKSFFEKVDYIIEEIKKAIKLLDNNAKFKDE